MPFGSEALARPLPQPLAAVRRGRVLVVDDNQANRDLLVRRLVKDAHEVETAENGRIALERLAAEPFDLVLLDVMMPEMNGYEVLERLKADPVLRHVPVIMITAVDEMDSIVRCIELGAEDHLPKPFNATLLRARIDAALAKKRLHDREQMHARSLERELEIGRNIQRSFLPESLPPIPGWELAVAFRPARQVAGDFYDVFALPHTDRIALVVADVCGKGVAAAVFMAAFRTLLRAGLESSTLRPVADDDQDDRARLTAVVAFLNDYVARTHTSENMFTTLFTGIFEPATGRLAYINAGHDQPAILRGDGGVDRLEPTGPAVGLLPGLPFVPLMTTLGDADTLLAFTDGVSDARSERGDSFGEPRLVERLRAAGSAAEVVARIERDVFAHIGDAEQFDDVTLLALRRPAGVAAPRGATLPWA